MANQIPFSGASNAAGGYILPDEQGDILTNGLLRESGAIQLVGDSRATSVRKTEFGIWLGLPTADFVGEGAKKPVTGGEFGQAVLNIKKIASIVLFTDEMIEDVQAGDLNPLVDAGVRSAIADVIDAHILGWDSGVSITTSFDSALNATTQVVEYDQTKADGLELAISAAMGKLEANGYGDVGNMGAVLGAGFAQVLRDARSAADSTVRVYGNGRDPLYGMQGTTSTNLVSASTAPAAGAAVGFVVHKPNLHVRIRKDVQVTPSTEATVDVAGTPRNLYQENLTAARYETRLGFMVHDLSKAVVKIINVV